MNICIASNSSEYFQAYKSELKGLIGIAQFIWLTAVDFVAEGRIENVEPSIILVDTLSKDIAELNSVFNIVEEDKIHVIFMENKLSELTQLSSTGYFRSLAKKILSYEDKKILELPRAETKTERIAIVCGGLGATTSLKTLVNEANNKHTSMIVIQQADSVGISAILSFLRKGSKADIISLVRERKLKPNQVYLYHPEYSTTINDFGVFLPKHHPSEGRPLSLTKSLVNILKTTRAITVDLIILSGMEKKLADTINSNREKISRVIVEQQPVVATAIEEINKKCTGVVVMSIEGIVKIMENC
jgi:hypothetical protein